MRSLKRMSTIVAIVALTLGGGAFAKIAQSDVPDNMLGPLQARLPARVELPPGVLEGQSLPRYSPPAGPGAPVVTRTAPGEAEATLTARNATRSAVWVTIYRHGAFYRAGCVAVNGEGSWPLRDGITRIRAEVTSGAQCQPPVRCDASIAPAPGTSAYELHGGATGCAWHAGAPRTVKGDDKNMLQKGSGFFKTINTTAAPLWVTIYDNGIPRRILDSGCVAPGASEQWSAWPYTHSSYFVRGEMTKNANCAQPVACDTTMELLAWKYRNHRYNYWAEFKANPRNCWWDHGFR